MSSLSPGPGRTYLYGLYGSLIAVVSGVIVYLEGGTGYGGFCVAAIGMIWTVIRFYKEKKNRK